MRLLSCRSGPIGRRGLVSRFGGDTPTGSSGNPPGIIAYHRKASYTALMWKALRHDTKAGFSSAGRQTRIWTIAG
jgi:hypothetical protein